MNPIDQIGQINEINQTNQINQINEIDQISEANEIIRDFSGVSLRRSSTCFQKKRKASLFL